MPTLTLYEGLQGSAFLVSAAFTMSTPTVRLDVAAGVHGNAHAAIRLIIQLPVACLRCLLTALVCRSRCTRFLNLSDLRSHPTLQRRFQPGLIVPSFEILDCFAFLVQRNEMTRDLLPLVTLINKINQLTFGTRVRAIWVTIINAGQGVLKGGL